MIGTFTIVDRILRGWPFRPQSGVLVAVVGGAFYGAIMGTFSERALQMFFSAIKVPILLATTTALALPSFLVLNTLLGLRNDLPKALLAILSTQAAVGVILASLAPFTALWYLTTEVYQEATLFNGLMFLIASTSAQWVLRRRYAELIASNPRHRVMLWVWIVVYSFVGIQMGWLLRPFIGDPNQPTTFLRTDTWGNAYVIVSEMIRGELLGK